MKPEVENQQTLSKNKLAKSSLHYLISSTYTNPQIALSEQQTWTDLVELGPFCSFLSRKFESETRIFFLGDLCCSSSLSSLQDKTYQTKCSKDRILKQKLRKMWKTKIRVLKNWGKRKDLLERNCEGMGRCPKTLMVGSFEDFIFLWFL